MINGRTIKKLLFAPFPEWLEDSVQGAVGLLGLALALIGTMDGIGSGTFWLGVILSATSIAPLGSKYFGLGEKADRPAGFLWSLAIWVVIMVLLALPIGKLIQAFT